MKDAIKSLKIEEKLVFGTFYVKKKSSSDFCLFDTRSPYRSRWGNLSQITEDAEYAKTYGCLPPAAGERW